MVVSGTASAQLIREAPADGVAASELGLVKPRSAKAFSIAARTDSAAGASTSAMMQPPKPPPVLRAPTAPAPGPPPTAVPRLERGVDGHVELGDRDLEVVAQRGVRGGEQRADLAQPPGAQEFDGVLDPA